MPLTLDQAPEAAKKLGGIGWDAIWTGGLLLGGIITTACGYADYTGAVGGYAAYLGAAALAGAGSLAFSGYKLGRSFWNRSNTAAELAQVTTKEISYRQQAEAALNQVAIDIPALTTTIQADAAFTATPGTAVANVVGARAAQLATARNALATQRT